MIRRYYIASGGGRHTDFTNNVLASSTSQTSTYDTTLTGPPGCIVTLQVTTFTHSDPGADFKVNGTSYILNDTFPLTLDPTGNNTFTWFMDVGTSSSGNIILIVLTIIAVSKNNIGSHDTQQNDKVI